MNIRTCHYPSSPTFLSHDDDNSDDSMNDPTKTRRRGTVVEMLTLDVRPARPLVSVFICVCVCVKVQMNPGRLQPV